MFCLRYPVDSLHKCLPAAALRSQNLLAGGCEAVITPASLAALFNPSALNPSALFEAIEQGIEGCDIEADSAAGALFDEL
jgi:hypothetical protein